MSDIKCPICGEMLQKYGEVDPDTGTSIVLGANCPKCGIRDSDIKLWQELIRTRKAFADTKQKLDDLQKDYDLAVQHAKTMTETCLGYKNKLDIAVDALEEAREEIGKIKNNDCPCGKPHIWFTIDNALEQIKDNDKDVK